MHIFQKEELSVRIVHKTRNWKTAKGLQLVVCPVNNSNICFKTLVIWKALCCSWGQFYIQALTVQSLSYTNASLNTLEIKYSFVYKDAEPLFTNSSIKNNQNHKQHFSCQHYWIIIDFYSRSFSFRTITSDHQQFFCLEQKRLLLQKCTLADIYNSCCGLSTHQKDTISIVSTADSRWMRLEPFKFCDNSRFWILYMRYFKVFFYCNTCMHSVLCLLQISLNL